MQVCGGIMAQGGWWVGFYVVSILVKVSFLGIE